MRERCVLLHTLQRDDTHLRWFAVCVCGLLLHPELHQRCLLNMRRMNSTCTKCGNDSSSRRHVTLLRTARECVIITFMRVGHIYTCRSVCVCVCVLACMHAYGRVYVCA